MISQLLKLLLLTALLVQQEVPLVDLTNVVVRPRLREPISASGSGSLVGYATTRPQAQPLSLEIVKLGRAPSLTPAALIFCEVQLQNIGKRPIDIPVDPSSRDMEPALVATPYEYLNAVLWFQNSSSTDSTPLARKLPLFGARNVSGSLKTLQPGEAIRIRANVPMPPLGEAHNGPQDQALKAYFALYHDTIRPIGHD